MTASERPPLLKEPWRSMTLPGLSKGAGLMRPDRPIVIDSGNAATLLGRPAKTLTSAALEREVELLARKLTALGLRPGDRVLLQLPNTVEAAIGILGVLTAGGVPAVTPVFTDQTTLIAQCMAVEAAGILTVTRFAGAALAEGARAVIAQCETIRFAAAFGERTPAGVAALDSWTSVEFFDDRPVSTSIAPNDAALITFDTVEGLRAFSRTHEQLIGEAAAATALAQIGPESQMLVTLPPASLAGIVFGLVAPLLTGAAANLTALFDGCAFAQSLGDGKRLNVVLPAAAEEAFNHHCSGRKIRAETLVFVHRPEAGQAVMPTRQDSRADRTLDCLALGESCLWFSRRGKSALKSGNSRGHAIFAGTGQPLEFMADNGRLLAIGPLAPTRIGATDSAIETGFSAGLMSLTPVERLTPSQSSSAA